MTDKRDALAVLTLLVGLICFLFLWAIHKLLAPEQFQRLARNFDDVDRSTNTVHPIRAEQICVLFLALIGIVRPFAYGAMALTNTFTVFHQWRPLP